MTHVFKVNPSAKSLNRVFPFIRVSHDNAPAFCVVLVYTHSMHICRTSNSCRETLFFQKIPRILNRIISATMNNSISITKYQFIRFYWFIQCIIMLSIGHNSSKFYSSDIELHGKVISGYCERTKFLVDLVLDRQTVTIPAKSSLHVIAVLMCVPAEWRQVVILSFAFVKVIHPKKSIWIVDTLIRHNEISPFLFFRPLFLWPAFTNNHYVLF